MSADVLEGRGETGHEAQAGALGGGIPAAGGARKGPHENLSVEARRKVITGLSNDEQRAPHA